MRYIILITILSFFTIETHSSLASIVQDTGDKYIVKSVHAEGVSFENEKTTKQAALSQAKQQALNDLLKHLQRESETTISEPNINAMISTYNVVDEYYNENFYALVANFTFDKTLLNSFLAGNEPTKQATGHIANYIVTLKEQFDIIAEYVKLKEYLQSEKIKYSPREITATSISVLLEYVNEDDIYKKLKELNLNGSMYID